MLLPTLIHLFRRDLARLSTEIESYQFDRNLWRTDQSILNSGGNLCLHLIGNLNAFICGELGGSGYVRNRPAEFNRKYVSQEELVQGIIDTMKCLEDTLKKMKEEDLEKTYDILVFEEKTTTGFFLVHLHGHLNYHLGQINYHRRLLDH